MHHRVPVGVGLTGREFAVGEVGDGNFECELAPRSTRAVAAVACRTGCLIELLIGIPEGGRYVRLRLLCTDIACDRRSRQQHRSRA